MGGRGASSGKNRKQISIKEVNNFKNDIENYIKKVNTAGNKEYYLSNLQIKKKQISMPEKDSEADIYKRKSGSNYYYEPRGTKIYVTFHASAKNNGDNYFAYTKNDAEHNKIRNNINKIAQKYNKKYKFHLNVNGAES